MEDMLQVSIACFPCVVELTLGGVFLWKDVINKRNRSIEGFLSLFLAQKALELRLDHPVDREYSCVPVPLYQRKCEKFAPCGRKAAGLTSVTYSWLIQDKIYLKSSEQKSRSSGNSRPAPASNSSCGMISGIKYDSTPRRERLF